MAVIEDEPGAQTVADIISGDQFEIYMSSINLGEASEVSPVLEIG
jgi:uncharacterized protein with PIN domain